MSDEEVIIIIAQRATEGRNVQDNSVVIPCRMCGEPCFVSAGTISDHPTATVECLQCANLSEVEFVMPKPGGQQMRELEANGLSAEEVRQVLERARRGEL